MSELQLYKFLTDNGIEIHWRDEELVVWIPYYVLGEFAKLTGANSDDGTIAYLQEYHVAIDLVPVCEYHGINPENIKEKEND